mmetsp:Transcript_17938/g.20361  ORF Transcript_17938/g.20361 Transcript_17938/m.20361 type:complete len:234 (-) Transcript_17938:240-941(-)
MAEPAKSKSNNWTTWTDEDLPDIDAQLKQRYDLKPLNQRLGRVRIGNQMWSPLGLEKDSQDLTWGEDTRELLFRFYERQSDKKVALAAFCPKERTFQGWVIGEISSDRSKLRHETNEIAEKALRDFRWYRAEPFLLKFKSLGTPEIRVRNIWKHHIEPLIAHHDVSVFKTQFPDGDKFFFKRIYGKGDRKHLYCLEHSDGLSLSAAGWAGEKLLQIKKNCAQGDEYIFIREER